MRSTPEPCSARKQQYKGTNEYRIVCSRTREAACASCKERQVATNVSGQPRETELRRSRGTQGGHSNVCGVSGTLAGEGVTLTLSRHKPRRVLATCRMLFGRAGYSTCAVSVVETGNKALTSLWAGDRRVR